MNELDFDRFLRRYRQHRLADTRAFKTQQLAYYADNGIARTHVTENETSKLLSVKINEKFRARNNNNTKFLLIAISSLKSPRRRFRQVRGQGVVRSAIHC